MGWNQLDFKQNTPVFAGVEDGSNVYFVHSYYARPDVDDVIACTTNYGIEFCSAIHKDNITATQFHPEKSQDVGLRMLKNFAEIKE
jgi:glutamine amidotransferase